MHIPFMPRSRPHRVSLLAALLLIAVLPAGPARAQSAPSASTAAEHYRNGQRLYRARQFEEALSAYQSAYEVSVDPDYLPEIAKCHRRLGRYQVAVFFYQGYLTWRPDGAARAEVEREIAETETEQAIAAAPPQKPAWRRGWLWGVLGGSAVVLGGAVTAVVLLVPAQAPAVPSDTLGTKDLR